MENDTFYPKTREAWRKWLIKNHLKKSKIAVIRYKKHTNKPSPSYQELMHEAICFGWIDTTVKGIDDEKYMIRFARRTDKSRWSKNTLSYGKRLLEQGLMFPHGVQRYKEGLNKKTIDHDVPDFPDMPQDLEQELKKSNVLEKFNSFAPSYRRTYLRWLFHAKMPETRKKRIAIIIKNTMQNKNKLFN